MTAYKLDIYIGSDNGSRKIDREYVDKITEWADRNFPDGYTLVRARGYYNGSQEDSLVLSVLTDYDIDLKEQVGDLKQKLEQKAIAVAKYNVDVEFV
jgi:hypothetical protein